MVCVFAIFIIARAFNINVVQGNYWKKVAEDFTYEYRDIEAVRGNIFDVNGNLLATSLPYYEIAMDVNADGISDKLFNENIDSLAYSLSNMFQDKTKNEYKKEIVNARNNNKRYLVLQKNVSYTDLQTVKKFPLFRKGRYKGGLITVQTNKRELPFRFLAARTVGYYNENSKAIGLEGAFNVELKGVGGKRLMRKITGGVEMPVNDDNEVEPQDGLDLVSTIDINIQDVAENSLMQQLIKNKADHGCVILMEVETGEIRAIANLTRKDSSTYVENFNWAIGSATEPGSTFKLMSLMAAIEDGYLNLNDKVDLENGVTSFYGVPMKDSHAPKKNLVTAKEVFEQSSNVGVSKLITKYYAKDQQKFIDRMCKMGLNKPLGISISGEGAPLIKNTNDKSWSGISLPFISIGYESLLTPLQILNFYNAVANNGKMVKPIFVKELRKRGVLVKTFLPEVINPSICSKQTIDKAKELMESVVENGTAKLLKSTIYKVAGKTGTAQIAKGGKYKKDGVATYQASFVGYFPADKPKYSCIVMVSAPSGGEYYGAQVAAPIFKDVADKIYSASLDIHKQINASINKFNSLPFTQSASANDIQTIYSFLNINNVSFPSSNFLIQQQSDSTKYFAANTISKLLNKKITPNVCGMSLKNALPILEGAGFAVKVVGSGTIKKQSVQSGTSFKKGTPIIIELS